MAKTLLKAKGAITSILFVVVVMILGFATIAYVVWGPYINDYASMVTSIKSMYIYMIGKFNVSSHELNGGENIHEYAFKISNNFSKFPSFLLAFLAS